jgi:hypothetical protein
MVIISLLITANMAFAVNDSDCKAAKSKMLALAKGMQEGDKRVIPADVKADADMFFGQCHYRAGEFEFETLGVWRDKDMLVKKVLGRHVNVVSNGKIIVGRAADGTPHQTAVWSDGRKTEYGGPIAAVDVTYTLADNIIVDEEGNPGILLQYEPMRQKIQGYIFAMVRDKAEARDRLLHGDSGIGAFTMDHADSVAQQDKPVINRIPVLNDRLYKNLR